MLWTIFIWNENVLLWVGQASNTFGSGSFLPHALIENVITHEAYRKKGLATACLNYARKIAEKENCYKMMLLTGSKEESTLKFYEKAGYNRNDKTGYIQWI